MTHTHDAIRNRLLKEILEEEKPPLRYEDLKRSEWSYEFEHLLRELLPYKWVDKPIQLMKNRLIMGAFRYETFADKSKGSWAYDTAAEALVRLNRYQETGNTEHLIDAANMCLLEYCFNGKCGTQCLLPLTSSSRCTSIEFAGDWVLYYISLNMPNTYILRAAAYILRAYRYDKHPNKHFESVDDGIHTKKRRMR